MGAKQKADGFRALRASPLGQRQSELVQLIGELYQLSDQNRRFLSARFGDRQNQIEEYRQKVVEAMFPDILRKGAKVRVADAKQAITEYQRATKDGIGTLDLMMTFVEEGTAFAAEFGYGDDAFFASLERMLSSVLEQYRANPAAVADVIEPRLLHLRELARDIGWGYGDAVADAVATATRE
jgi:hypothetical protein